MRGKAAEHVLERIPEYTHLHVDKYTQMILLINQVLKKNNDSSHGHHDPSLRVKDKGILGL